MRIHPQSIVFRKCVKDYQIPGTNLTIEKGVNVMMSIYAIHRDENLFPDPFKLDPSRFVDEKLTETKRSFFGFGMGPRMCIGMKLGMVSVMAGLVTMLKNYRYELENNRKIQIDPSHILTRPVDGIPMRIFKR